MAQLVAAFGTSHSPALGSSAEDFVEHARRDETYEHHLDLDGNPATYTDLVRRAEPSIAAEITPERIAARVTECANAIARLAAAIAAAQLDVLVVVGDDQREQYRDENLPAFLVYWGERITNTVCDLPDSAPAYWKRARAQYHEPDGPRDYPVAADLGRHLIECLIDQEFDVAHGRKLPRDRGEGHAFGFVHRRLIAYRIIPVLPIAVNTYYPPNQPRPGRCYRLGQAIRTAIERWPEDRRVGILASGGLSHFTVNEALDRSVLDACRAGDGMRFAALPLAQLNSGNSEIRNWIVAAGAAEGLKTRWQAYIPFYRTLGGTGCAMAFAEWG